MNKVALFLLISLSNQFSLGDVTYVEVGSPAPYTGYLFSPESEKEARQHKSDALYYQTQYNTAKKLITKEQELNNNLEMQIAGLSTVAQIQEKEIKRSRDNNFYYAVGGAILSYIVYTHVK